jgi:hypothetical protein
LPQKRAMAFRNTGRCHSRQGVGKIPKRHVLWNKVGPAPSTEHTKKIREWERNFSIFPRTGRLGLHSSDQERDRFRRAIIPRNPCCRVIPSAAVNPS